jgi:hypothetical protein
MGSNNQKSGWRLAIARRFENVSRPCDLGWKMGIDRDFMSFFRAPVILSVVALVR